MTTLALIRCSSASSRRCRRCSCLLSSRADPRDTYCWTCHPTSERGAGAILRAAREHGSSSEASDAAHELAARRWRTT